VAGGACEQARRDSELDKGLALEVRGIERRTGATGLPNDCIDDSVA
jgi:hypothetical protein